MICKFRVSLASLMVLGSVKTWQHVLGLTSTYVSILPMHGFLLSSVIWLAVWSISHYIFPQYIIFLQCFDLHMFFQYDFLWVFHGSVHASAVQPQTVLHAAHHALWRRSAAMTPICSVAWKIWDLGRSGKVCRDSPKSSGEVVKHLDCLNEVDTRYWSGLSEANDLLI